MVSYCRRVVGSRRTLPVRVHVAEQVRLSCSLKDLGNVGVCSRRVTVCLICPITVIWPKAMDRPRIYGSGLGAGVPELRLEKCATGGIEAAQV